jgi:small subunit ribosomal protein S9
MKKVDYIYAVGRRKSSSARVRLFKGKGENTVNGMNVERYFDSPVFKNIWSKAFKQIDLENKYYASIKVVGGGKKGQLDAVIHGFARSLAKAEKDSFRLSLKKAGLLTRDARIRERRKVGTGGKARREKQSPKR